MALRRSLAGVASILLLGVALTACGAPGGKTPLASKALFPDLVELQRIATEAAQGGSVQSATVYSTARSSASRAGTGASPNPPEQRIEVLVLKGHFVCPMVCSPPGGTPPRPGRFMTVVYVHGFGLEDMGLVNGHPGPQLGQACVNRVLTISRTQNQLGASKVDDHVLKATQCIQSQDAADRRNAKGSQRR
jgi:hypothetical protein